ncbi:MAG: sensor histidine kinase, partial [Acidimicrobiia bacterium]
KEAALREHARVLLAGPDDAARERAAALGIGCLSVVPLRASSSIGALLLGWREEHTPADDATIADVATRAALAVENARLFDQARQATRARDEMLGVVAHDLRNPLNTISLAAQLLLEQLPADQQPLERRQAEIIGRAVAGMNRLIQDLLDVKRIEHGLLALEPASIDLASVVQDAVELLRPLATARRLALETSLAPVEHVRADPVRVQQVISNLVGNAIKFTPIGGRIRVDLIRNDVELAIRVSDTGRGITAEEIPHIFSRFWQSRRSDQRGIGLGLAIARGIVEAHGGRIWVESRPGEGSMFVFTLPAESTYPPASGYVNERREPQPAEV